MSLASVSHYVANTPQDPASLWREIDLVAMSVLAPPQDVLQRNETVVRADTHALWFRWFLEGLCNPLRYVGDESKTIVDVLGDTLARVNELYPGEPLDERKVLAQRLAKRVMIEVERRRQLERIGALFTEKRALIDDAVAEPRCWICGFRFGQDAIDKFLKKRKGIELELPEFVDLLRPRGLYTRDVGIEVEHIVPVAEGGGGKGNLALACGWCNKNKGARHVHLRCRRAAAAIVLHSRLPSLA